MSDVYYRIFKDEDGLTVVCLQDFDEPDYDQSKFYNKSKYATEEEARSAIDQVLHGVTTFLDNTLINEIRNEQFNKGIEYALNILATEAIKEFPRGARFLEAYELVENEAKNKGWLKK